VANSAAGDDDKSKLFEHVAKKGVRIPLWRDDLA
jgi:hypothetical protein